MANDLSFTVAPPPIEKGMPAPSRVTSPSKVRSAKLPFSQDLARDVESLSTDLNALYRTLANNSPSVSIPTAAKGSPGLVQPDGTTVTVNPNGTISASPGVSTTVRTVTANATFASTDYTIFADASAGVLTALLPPTPNPGEVHNLTKIDASANAVTLDGNGKNINEGSIFVLWFQDWSVTVQYNGTGWRIF